MKIPKEGYIVHPNGFGKEYHCETKSEVWEAITKLGWGGYTVSSPNGLDVSEFIPF